MSYKYSENILLHPRPAKWGGPAIWLTRVSSELKKRGYKCDYDLFHYTGLLWRPIDFVIMSNAPRQRVKIFNLKKPVYSIMGQGMSREWCEKMGWKWLPEYEREIDEMANVIVRSTKILFISNYVKDVWRDLFKELKKEFPEDKANVVLHGIEIDKFTPRKEKRKTEKFTIGSAGSMRGRFRLKTLFQSSKLLKMAHRILLVGSLDSECFEELEIARRDPRLKRIIEHIPWVNVDKLPKYYQQMDCLYHPVAGEPFGNVVAEALACGVPVVCPEYGGPAEFVLPNGGITVKTEKWTYDNKFTEDMAAAVTKVWNNLELYSLGARKQAEAISMEKIIDQYLNLMGYPKKLN